MTCLTYSVSNGTAPPLRSTKRVIAYEAVQRLTHPEAVQRLTHPEPVQGGIENVACSCHIVVGDQSLPESESVMRAVEEKLCGDCGIGHTTIQFENCAPCHEEAEHLKHHNHPHFRLAALALEDRRRTPLSRRPGAAKPSQPNA